MRVRRIRCLMPQRGTYNVMTSSESSPTLQASSTLAHQYPELPDEPRPGKIRPSTPTTTTTGTNSTSPSPRAGTNSTTSSLGGTNNTTGAASGSGADSPEVEAIEEAVPIGRSTLPSPEPQPVYERNGYKGSALKLEHNDKVDGDIKYKHRDYHDLEDDSCLIKCIYFTQQCCECTII
ncbi:uncharacterized protein LOC106647149 isoform X1 [Copidosoma floridanum]|uniref:uncharacterized protein LOC106647149 isoform X1 n=1 Tax=Copidosoma floridanum TaxID=29053 RepID=UPI000C6FC565|nr:uncharacterized protein LOC106647149 isoform X1 [Copidosoma floridanum]